MAVLRRRRLGLIAALSLALHGVLLAWLARSAAPNLFANGPDLSSMSVELLRPAPERPKDAPAAGRPVAGPVASAARPADTDVPSLPSVSEGLGPVPAPAAPAPAAGQADLRAVLRSSAGCTRGASRSREEREACEERLGSLRAPGRDYAAPMDPGKRAYYDELAAAGPSGQSYGDPQPAAVTPGGVAYFRVLNCSVKFGAGRKEKDRQGMVRLGRTPCYVPVQGSFFTPEASVRKR